MDFVFVIYSCQKNLKRAETLYNVLINHCNSSTYKTNIKFLICYGDNQVVDSLESKDYRIVDDRYLVVNVADDYEHLSEKSVQLFRAVSHKYPGARGCFKCDDDIIPHREEFQRMFDIVMDNNIHYYGKVRDIITNTTNHKSEEQHEVPTTTYCCGPLYYLSSHAIKFIQQPIHMFYYEDITIGHHLYINNIQPTHYEDIYCDYFEFINRFTIHNQNHKPVLYINITGGLGNQLFQIASAYGIAKKHNRQLVISYEECRNTHVSDNYKYFHTIFQGLPHTNRCPVSPDRVFLEQEHDCFFYNDAILNSQLNECENFALTGYFQCEAYFKWNRNDIVYIFIRPHILNEIRDTFPTVDTSYFIHIRRGDYVNHPLYTIDYHEYYTKALAFIQEHDPGDHHFYIVSDDIDFCKNYGVLDSVDNKTYVENLDEVKTLYLMSLCRRGGICANSTFSWWGGYLNESWEKKVIFPKQWYNIDWIPNNIYFEGSIVLDCSC